ncbi:hypothetical protein [Candidatus Pyrohabitans sp.]
MRKLWLVISLLLFFPLSLPLLLLARRGESSTCFPKPDVDCVGCEELEYAFRRRGLPPIAYVEDALLVCSVTGARASVAQWRLRKALAKMR